MNIWLSIFGPTTHGESAAQVAAGVRRAGANALLVFTSLYHGYRLLQRRYPQKAIYTLETDRVFWQPDQALYKDCAIQPQRSRELGAMDLVAELAEACKTEGVLLSALVPVCAGERLAQEYPDLAVTNLYGAKDRLFLCYNNPAVRAYRMAMIRDLVGRYELDALMLDKIPQIMLEQRAFSGLFDAPLRTVGSFCFCQHCQAAGKKYGLNLDEARARALEIARRSLKIPAHIVEALGHQLVGDTEIPLLLLEEPLIRRMLEFRFQSAVDFVGELKRLAKSLRPRLIFQAAFVPPAHIGHDMTSPRAWLTIQSYKLYREVLDEIFCVVHWDAQTVRFETERSVAAVEGKTRVVTSMRLYGATRPEEVAELAEAALAGGSQGVSFLGYDVAGDELLNALRAWSDSCDRPAQAGQG
ncbi:MAG: hypothetical protein HYV35_05660 [Lentisphaerae bacterium]|nr:hypothetical protein [Lentisphaerota bacterium]